MARTFLRQATQIRNSTTYDDAVTVGSTMESAATEIQFDLNAIRSKLKLDLWADSAGNWYDDIQTVNSKKRGITDLNTDLNDLEIKPLLVRTEILTDITVGATDNWKILVVASSEAPSVNIAIALTVEGAVTAQSALTGVPFEVNELTEIAGPNALTPKNLCIVRDSTTGEPIESSLRDIYALLQCESTATDDTAFDDTTSKGKLSFVRQNAALDDLEAVPAADIQTKGFNYAYAQRYEFDNIPEDAFLSGGFLDMAGVTDVTLSNALLNQSGNADQLAKNIAWVLTDTFKVAWTDPAAAVDILSVNAAAGGDSVVMNVATVDINNTGTVDMSGTLVVDSGGASALTMGATDGLIDAAAALSWGDGNRAASTWSLTGINLSDNAAEWSTFETEFGEVSLMNAIAQAKNTTRGTKTYANVTVQTAADTDIGGVAGGANLDAQLPDMSAGTFVDDYDVYLNGDLMRGGATGAANNDYYPGTSLANGQLTCEFQVEVSDVFCVIPYAI